MQKSDITVAMVTGLVASQFRPWARLPIRPVALDGWDNTTFRLGEELLVRLPSAAPYVAQVEKEHRWLPELAAHLPLPIPQPLALGAPGAGYPFPWSVYSWLSGKPATASSLGDSVLFATDLSAFLSTLYRVDPSGGPEAGPHSFYRGGPVATYDEETRTALAMLTGVIDTAAALATWEAAVSAPPPLKATWVHGDVAPSNLLVADGRLSAVIDFGCSAVGDLACDLVMAWTFFTGKSRAAFRAGLDLDDATWARARGWALWKAAITLAREVGGDQVAAEAPHRWGWRVGSREVIGEVIGEASRSQN